MADDLQRAENMKQSAKYRRHMRKKKKHERNTGKVDSQEGHRRPPAKRHDFDKHRPFVHMGQSKKVTSGRLSVPRGLFLKGRASSLLKKNASTFLNPLTYARKREELNKIINIGMGNVQPVDGYLHHKNDEQTDSLPVQRPEEITNFDHVIQETRAQNKRRKHVDHLKDVLGLNNPGPSFEFSPDIKFNEQECCESVDSSAGSPVLERNNREICDQGRGNLHEEYTCGIFHMAQQENEPTDRNLCMYDSTVKPDTQKNEIGELDDIYIEKLVSDIGLFAWNSRKPASEPYENCEGKLIKEILSLRNIALHKAEKCKKNIEHTKLIKEPEATTHLDRNVGTSSHKMAVYESSVNERTPNNVINLPAVKETSISKQNPLLDISLAEKKITDYGIVHSYRLDMCETEPLQTYFPGKLRTNEEAPSGMVPLPADITFVSPSTPQIPQHAFDPKAFMQDIEQPRKSAGMVHHMPQVPSFRGSGSSGSHHLHEERSEFPESLLFPEGEYAESSGESDDSEQIYKYRRSMF